MNVVHKKLSKARKLSKEVEVEALSKGIICMPLLSEQYCRHLIIRAEEFADYEPVIDDWEVKTVGKKGKEVGLSKIGESERFYLPFRDYVIPAIKLYFDIQVTEVLQPFIIKYSMDGVRSMDRHF